MNIKSLAKDTALYGISSIVGRFLNYLLSILLYTKIFPAESGGYGIITNLYSWAALMLAFLTFGMETTFFRFAGKSGENPDKVFSTALKMVGVTGMLFVICVMCFIGPISSVLGYSEHPEYIGCFAVITAFDSFQAILFSRLRQQKRPVKFLILKLSFIFASILLNLLTFLVIPQLFGSFPGLEALYMSFDNGVGLIFFINLVCTVSITLGFIPEMKDLSIKFDKSLCTRMLSYTWPLLLFSVVGIFNLDADKILFKLLVPGKDGDIQLGIFGACSKIAMIMAMLVQAFRYAYEPIVFGEAKNSNKNRKSNEGESGSDVREKTLADGMKWFIIFSLLAFLAVIFYLPILKLLIGKDYWEGLGVVPIVMLGQLFMGIYFNLSFWYKLTDKTWWGAIINVIAAVVLLTVNIVFVPRIGYWACAWGGPAGYGVAMFISWALSQKYLPVHYDGKSLLTFAVIAAGYYFLYGSLKELTDNVWILISGGTVLLISYCWFIFNELKKDRII